MSEYPEVVTIEGQYVRRSAVTYVGIDQASPVDVVVRLACGFALVLRHPDGGDPCGDAERTREEIARRIWPELA